MELLLDLEPMFLAYMNRELSLVMSEEDEAKFAAATNCSNCLRPFSEIAKECGDMPLKVR